MRLGNHLSSLTTPKLEYTKSLLNLSEDESAVFDMLSHRKTITEISIALNISPVKAMAESEYGKDYDENGAYKYYTPYYHDSEHMNKGDMDYSASKMRQGRPDTMYPSRFYYSEGDRGYLGKSGNVRRKYFESKDPSSKMQSLEDYANTLNEDLSEMVSSASDNEKAMLKNKLQMIAQRL